MVVCDSDSIQDWYTIFAFYPTYSGTVHCNSAATYPRSSLLAPSPSSFFPLINPFFFLNRSSLVYLFLFYCIVFLFLIRAPVIFFLGDARYTNLIYGPAYFLPLFILCHFALGGVICKIPLLPTLEASLDFLFFSFPFSFSSQDFGFPYILIVFTLLFDIVPFSAGGLKIFLKIESLLFFLNRYLLLAFSTASIWFYADISDPLIVTLVSLLSPLVPVLVFFATSKYTHPSYFSDD